MPFLFGKRERGGTRVIVLRSDGRMIEEKLEEAFSGMETRQPTHDGTPNWPDER